MAERGIQPYLYEPENDSDHDPLSSDDNLSSDEIDEEEDSRLGTTDWCSCTNCVAMPTSTECVCCRELLRQNSKMNEVTCITEHGDFLIVCLHREVLRTALIARADIRQDHVEIPEQNDKLRHQAYRQFTYWIHQRLGRYVRRVIPACAVQCIRKAFPSSDGQYVGFAEADL